MNMSSRRLTAVLGALFLELDRLSLAIRRSLGAASPFPPGTVHKCLKSWVSSLALTKFSPSVCDADPKLDLLTFVSLPLTAVPGTQSYQFLVSVSRASPRTYV
jgi:hypothetical protein